MSDMDVDGSHIGALLYNLVAVCAPSLLQVQPDFVCRFATSLIRVQLPRSADEIGFYSERAYEVF